MYRYSVELYSGRKFKTISTTDNKLLRETKYLQILGFKKYNKIEPVSIWDCQDREIKGYKLVVVENTGRIKTLSSPVKNVTRELI